jgi:hypothetical protein
MRENALGIVEKIVLWWIPLSLRARLLRKSLLYYFVFRPGRVKRTFSTQDSLKRALLTICPDRMGTIHFRDYWNNLARLFLRSEPYASIGSSFDSCCCHYRRSRTSSSEFHSLSDGVARHCLPDFGLCLSCDDGFGCFQPNLQLGLGLGNYPFTLQIPEYKSYRHYL